MTLAAPIEQISPPSAAAMKSRRLIQLDVLRGLAILLVLGWHAVVDANDAGALKIPAKIWAHLGWTGVDLFFVLSGFLVGGLLLEELRTRQRLDAKRFIIRRLFKIWPAYYTLVIGAFLIDSRTLGAGGALRLYLPNLLHAQNYFGTAPLGPTWSLAVEEHFYLALPLLLLTLASLPPHGGKRINDGDEQSRLGLIHWLPAICLAIMAACTSARVILNLHRPYNDWTHYFPTHLRIDGLAFGVLLAHFYHFKPQALRRIARHRLLLLAIGAALISPMARLGLFDYRFVWTVGYTFLYLGYGCILIAFVHTPLGPAGGLLGRFFTTPAARFFSLFGFYSYSIYLWHITLVRHPFQSRIMPSVHLMDHHATAHWLIWMGLYIAATLLVGVVLGRLIEIPALALRDRLFPGRTRAVESPK